MLTGPRTVLAMVGRKSPHPVSEAVAAEASRYLAVIEHVLALDYIKPDLRRKVVRMQRQLITVEINSRYPLEDAAEAPA